MGKPRHSTRREDLDRVEDASSIGLDYDEADSSIGAPGTSMERVSEKEAQDSQEDQGDPFEMHAAMIYKNAKEVELLEDEWQPTKEQLEALASIDRRLLFRAKSNGSLRDAVRARKSDPRIQGAYLGAIELIMKAAKPDRRECDVHHDLDLPENAESEPMGPDSLSVGDDIYAPIVELLTNTDIPIGDSRRIEMRFGPMICKWYRMTIRFIEGGRAYAYPYMTREGKGWEAVVGTPNASLSLKVYSEGANYTLPKGCKDAVFTIGKRELDCGMLYRVLHCVILTGPWRLAKTQVTLESRVRLAYMNKDGGHFKMCMKGGQDKLLSSGAVTRKQLRLFEKFEKPNADMKFILENDTVHEVRVEESPSVMEGEMTEREDVKSDKNTTDVVNSINASTGGHPFNDLNRDVYGGRSKQQNNTSKFNNINTTTRADPAIAHQSELEPTNLQTEKTQARKLSNGLESRSEGAQQSDKDIAASPQTNQRSGDYSVRQSSRWDAKPNFGSFRRPRDIDTGDSTDLNSHTERRRETLSLQGTEEPPTGRKRGREDDVSGNMSTRTRTGYDNESRQTESQYNGDDFRSSVRADSRDRSSQTLPYLVMRGHEEK